MAKLRIINLNQIRAEKDMKKLIVGIIVVPVLVLALGTAALACGQQIDVNLGIEGTNFGSFDLRLGENPESIKFGMESGSKVSGFGSLHTTGGLAGGGIASWDGVVNISSQMDFGSVQINASIWNRTKMTLSVDP